MSLKLNDRENDIYYHNRSQKTEIKVIHDNKIEYREITLNHPTKNNQDLNLSANLPKEISFQRSKEIA